MITPRILMRELMELFQAFVKLVIDSINVQLIKSLINARSVGSLAQLSRKSESLELQMVEAFTCIVA